MLGSSSAESEVAGRVRPELFASSYFSEVTIWLLSGWPFPLRISCSLRVEITLCFWRMAWDLLLLLEAAAPVEVPSCASLDEEFGAAAPLSTASAYPA